MELIAIAVLCNCILLIASHGYLRKPISRNALFLKFADAKLNWNRLGLNCGGANHQWNVCRGKCGVCGDPCDVSKKPHEPGGIYFDGRIGAKYEIGQIIDVEVAITSNHQGYFKFRVAKATNEGRVTQQELDMHQLQVLKPDCTFSYRYNLPSIGNKIFKMKVKLPDGFTCTRCVFQWYYTTGKNWTCPTCSLENGNPESFVNCADIKIVDSARNRVNGRNGHQVNGFPGNGHQVAGYAGNGYQMKGYQVNDYAENSYQVNGRQGNSNHRGNQASSIWGNQVNGNPGCDRKAGCNGGKRRNGNRGASNYSKSNSVSRNRRGWLKGYTKNTKYMEDIENLENYNWKGITFGSNNQNRGSIERVKTESSVGTSGDRGYNIHGRFNQKGSDRDRNRKGSFNRGSDYQGNGLLEISIPWKGKTRQGKERGRNKGSGNRLSGSQRISTFGNGHSGNVNQAYWRKIKLPNGNQRRLNQERINIGSSIQGCSYLGISVFEHLEIGSGNHESSIIGNVIHGGIDQGNGNRGNRQRKYGKTRKGNIDLNSLISKTKNRDRTCVAIGPFIPIPRMTEWCTFNCNHTPPFCPTNVCMCF